MFCWRETSMHRPAIVSATALTQQIDQWQRLIPQDLSPRTPQMSTGLKQTWSRDMSGALSPRSCKVHECCCQAVDAVSHILWSIVRATGSPSAPMHTDRKPGAFHKSPKCYLTFSLVHPQIGPVNFMMEVTPSASKNITGRNASPLLKHTRTHFRSLHLLCPWKNSSLEITVIVLFSLISTNKATDYHSAGAVSLS